MSVLSVIVIFNIVGQVYSACECLSSDNGALSSYRNGDNSLNYQGFTYPSNYGIGCKAWDTDPNPLPPYCGDSLTGLALSDAPEWCHDAFCYVNTSACDLPLQYESQMFPNSGLVYSYQACGANSTFNTLFGASANGANSLTELADIVEDYVETLAQNLEDGMLENRFQSSCGYTSSCPCSTCQAAPGWGSVDFQHTLLKPFHDDASTVSILSSCLAADASYYFSRVAGAEYRNATAFATLYAGFQEDGVFLQWPAMEFCSTGYDPRFRPWYAAAATNPKLVVLVIDVSGSMLQNNRMNLAKSAANAVLNTLTSNDLLGIVLFNGDVAGIRAPQLMSDENRTAAENYINALNPSGRTNFVAPLSAALTMLEQYELCESLILFLTDGVADFGESDYENVQARASAINAPIFTYALGSGADTAVTERLACENEGISYAIGDGGDLAAAMSGYYEYFAAAITSNTTRWINYFDFATGTELLSGCVPFYDKRDTSSPTSIMAGVVCMDINIMRSVEQLRAEPDFNDLMARVQQTSRTCISRWQGVDDVEAAIESVRVRNEATGAKTCSSNSSSSNAGSVVGGIIGAIVGVVFIGGIIWAIATRAGSSSSNAAVSPAPAPAPAPTEQRNTDTGPVYSSAVGSTAPFAAPVGYAQQPQVQMVPMQQPQVQMVQMQQPVMYAQGQQPVMYAQGQQPVMVMQ